MQDMLTQSGPLGLAHHLLNVAPLPFGCVSSDDCKLMQLETVLESDPQMRMPSCGNLTIYFSPKIMLVHLAANPSPLGLRIIGQEVPQKLVCLGISLVLSLLGFFEHLLGLAELQLAGLLILYGTRTLGLTGLVKIL